MEGIWSDRGPSGFGLIKIIQQHHPEDPNLHTGGETWCRQLIHLKKEREKRKIRKEKEKINK